MSKKYRNIKHFYPEPRFSPGTLGEQIEKNKRKLFDQIAALVGNDDLADQIEEVILPFLIELEELNFNLGIYVAEALAHEEQTPDPME